ncbi:hypothetical protein DH2020_025059 [Rehmannia glutinosa]|uniref:F-box associated beta-propeller type 1 domain-containing protein n=1 Tax=Rehmannia glutinosa TaxID=99300 RepID=A0ABR0W544_REHGL
MRACTVSLSSVQNVGGYYLGGPCTGDYRQILASYDGLLCIRIDQSVYIWNPFLKTHSKILALTDFRTCYYGFGYDSRRDDYKLIKLERIRCRDTTETEVYSLRSRSWTKLDNFPNGYKHNLKFTSAFVNGSVHWLAINLFLKPNPFVLFSFDLLDNKYREMILPEFWPVSRYVVDVKLCVLRGMLCVLVYWNFCLVLWAMKDYYSDQKSWTKILDIRFDLVFDEYCTAVDIKPFYMYENGEVLMGVSSKHGTELLICKDNSVLFREIIFGNPYLIHYAFVHVESLISPLRVENREEFIP